MIISRRLFLSPVLSVLFIASVAQSQGDTKTQDEGKDSARVKVPAPLFAVVDMEKASGHTKAFAAAEKDMEAARSQYKQNLATLGGNLEGLDAQIVLLRPSPERDAREIEALTLQHQIKVAGEIYSQSLALINLQHTKKIYEEMNVAIADLAKRRGIALVMRKRPIVSIEDIRASGPPGLTEGDALSEQSRMFKARDVLYVAPEYDLTEDLIQFLKG